MGFRVQKVSQLWLYFRGCLLCKLPRHHVHQLDSPQHRRLESGLDLAISSHLRVCFQSIALTCTVWLVGNGEETAGP
jgi:hypothetical protein